MKSLQSSWLPWLVFAGFVLLVISLQSALPWLVEWPESWQVPIANWINVAVDIFVSNFKGFFKALAQVLEWPMRQLAALLQWLPWAATLSVFVIIAHHAGGRRLAIFTGCSLAYMVIVGYWSESMNTLALVGISVPLSVVGGFLLGVAAWRSARVSRVVLPLLDFMQTVPTFAYLIPVLTLFGFGPVVGLIASAIFAAPPMVRNTIVGLSSVSPEVRESGDMSGCTAWQRFWWVDVPSAKNQIVIGINQATMAALSMVIIAAIIGGFDDIGWEVLSTMRKAQFGQSLLAGLVIALLAMITDRIGRAYSDRVSTKGQHKPHQQLGGAGYCQLALVCVIGFVVLAQLIPALHRWPDAWRFYPANAMNQGVEWMLINLGAAMESIKRATLFFFLLPIRIGFSKAISPFSWGIEMTMTIKLIYLSVIVFLASMGGWRSGWRASVGVLLAGGLLWLGTTGTPWPLFIAATTLLAWQMAGPRVALLAAVSLGFMLVTGLWERAMLSVYLCGAAVLICFVLGTAIGVWAASSDRVSAFIRPINDTLQTMPQFVLLIPVLMLFKIGEFSALLAVIMYAIVPPIRYTEAGLRNVPEHIVEAAQSMGLTRWQMLTQVKLPMALPVIMLGLNQTVLFGLAMLVIAALVGTTGMGQEVYIALSNADVGRGVVAGVCMALIAIVADRMLQGWANERKRALGLS